MNVHEVARVQRSDSVATGPDILSDPPHGPSATVRASLSLNPMAAKMDVTLASGREERVRALLTRKLAALTPGLTAAAHGRLREDTIEALTNLVADEAERVRASIAEAIKHMPDAPRALILRLAADPAVMVCEPIIRFSPVLTSEDLVALIVSAPSPAMIMAAARRPRIDAMLCDAIVDAADTDAIGALLANPSAQIREATLDALVAHAAQHEGWQEPLVRRPCLPARAARALSQIVANHLLEVLWAREDLDPALADDVRDRLRQAAPATSAASVATLNTAAQQNPAKAAELESACALRDVGRIDDAAVLTAAQRGDVALATAMLAAKAGVPLAVIERAASLRSAKGLVSLSWKAGLSMRTSLALQVLVGHVQPDGIIHPRPGGGFPMSPQEMRWQLEFLSRTSR